MKIKNSIVSLVACAAVITFVGCKKSEPAIPDASTNAVAATADAAKDMAGKTADMAKDMTGQAVAAATATNAMAEATGKFDEGIAAAKKLIGDKDYQGALVELTKLSSMNLSDAQTKIVDGLKAEIQALIAKSTGGAVDAAKGLLGK